MSVRREKLLVAIVLQTLIATAFAEAQRWNAGIVSPPPPWLISRADAWIPFVPASVWLYASWYVAPIVIALADRMTFRRAAIAVLLGFLVCAIGWIAIPATMPRPNLDAESGASIAMLRTVYRMDPPANLFPSFHAALAAIIARVATGMPALVRLTVPPWMFLICVSCVTTKQHYLFDVLAGALVGFGTWGGAVRLVDYLGRVRGPRDARHHATTPPITSTSVAANATNAESGISAS